MLDAMPTWLSERVETGSSNGEALNDMADEYANRVKEEGQEAKEEAKEEVTVVKHKVAEEVSSIGDMFKSKAGDLATQVSQSVNLAGTCMKVWLGSQSNHGAG